MAKEVVGVVKLQIPAGQATPGPPVGVALGPRNVSPGEFCKKFNDQTRDQQGMIVGVEITVYADRTFTFVVKSPPASVLLKQAAGIAKGASSVKTEKVGQVTVSQLREIAEKKKKDLNAASTEAAVNMIRGTARSMGITVVEG
ncbi:MAG TPA: 50S ribosomal protein L11 [Planctomycetota bacterium]|nr:50S ribosomal protein L11 [Planctomycetota bacterium]